MDFLANETKEIPSLPFLGTTWATRGFRYWLRRILISLGFAAMCFFFLVTYVGVAYGLLTVVRSQAGRIGIIGLFALGAVWSTLSAWQAIRPGRIAMRHKDIVVLRELASHPTKSRRGTTASGAGLGLAALAGNGAATALVGLGSVFVVGWPMVLLVRTFGRYFSIAECLATTELNHRNR